jgi:hypothetical protein
MLAPIDHHPIKFSDEAVIQNRVASAKKKVFGQNITPVRKGAKYIKRHGLLNRIEQDTGESRGRLKPINTASDSSYDSGNYRSGK